MRRLRRLALCLFALGLGYSLLLALPELPPAGDGGPWIRVCLRADVGRLAVSCPVGLLIQDGDGGVLLEGATAVTVRREASSLVLAGDGMTAQSATLPLGTLKIRAADSQTPLTLGDERYRGALVLNAAHGRLQLLNALPLEEYLRGVAPEEMSPSAPLEALKAQAIVARTFAIASLSRHEREGYNLCGGVHCQVYGGASREQEASDQAVRETAGQILQYAGKPISAYYHANCGGETDSPAVVWGSSDSPSYLCGGPDAAGPLSEDLRAETGILALAAHEEEVFCGSSPEFSWQSEHSRAELERLFSRTLPVVLGRRATLGRLQSLTVEGRTDSGRATALRVQGDQGSEVVRGEEIRWLFGSGHADSRGLHSTRFVVRPIGDAGAVPDRYRFLGFGWGHGIGLCQAGAMGMARRGYTTAQILRHYYPGATLGSPAQSAP